MTVWVNREYLALRRITGSGSVTNVTSALGIYSTNEKKDTRLEMEFSPVSTNCTTVTEAVVE